MNPPAADRLPCPNCGQPQAADPAARYCPHCGQETRVLPPTVREFLQQFGGAYFSTEGALWRTLKLLVTRPGELTRQYLAGRRKHYVLPLRLYLTISVLVLLLVRISGGAGVVQVSIKPDAADAPDTKLGNATLSIGGGRAGLRDGKFYCNDFPGWFCQRLQRRIDIAPTEMEGAIEQFKERFLGNIGAGMFLLLPGFALWLKLVYLNRGLRYTEHLVFALHLHAFWFLALALTLPNQVWLTVPAFAAVPWYTLLAMRRVYGGRRWLRLLRAGLVGLLYLFTLGLTMTVIGLWSLLF